MRNKYHNRQVYLPNGERVDSVRELTRYNQLLILEKAGKITNLRRQVKYILVPAQYQEYARYSAKTGKALKSGRKLLERECAYIADFVYFDCALGKEVVEDTKGVRTPDYIIKRKLMLWVHGIRVCEV